jgi:hypothetical protein
MPKRHSQLFSTMVSIVENGRYLLLNDEVTARHARAVPAGDESSEQSPMLKDRQQISRESLNILQLTR